MTQLKIWFRERPFSIAVAGAMIIGGLIRLLYVSSFFGLPDPIIGGDGLLYHLEGLRLAEGLGYTSAFGDIGAETAHHPPVWVTLLGGASALGIDTVNGHQLLGVVIGLLVVLVAGLVGRLVFGPAAGAVAAMLAAVYPGFWVLDAQILAEPLALVLQGLTIMAFYYFADKFDVRHALVLGVLLGLITLTRSEQLALVLLLGPILMFRAPGVSLVKRSGLGMLVIICIAVLLSPWVIHNSKRFDTPVFMSTNMGTSLLFGNCPETFDGEYKGYYHLPCMKYVDRSLRSPDRAVFDRQNRDAAIVQIQENLDKLPSTIVARYGRAFGFYMPEQTIAAVAEWQGSQVWAVRAWVVSFWFVAGLAVVGVVAALRGRIFILPLILPIVLVLGVIAVFYGEPRYHTMADLSLVVLASFGLVSLPGGISSVASWLAQIRTAGKVRHQ